MTAEEIERVARRVVELLREEGVAGSAAPRLLDANEIAERFAVTADWVRANADRLGAVQLGNGPRPRLRFDPETVEAALNSRPGGGASSDERSRFGSGVPSRRRRPRTSGGAGQLAVRSVDVSDLPQRTPRRGGRRPGPTPGDNPDATR